MRRLEEACGRQRRRGLRPSQQATEQHGESSAHINKRPGQI
jgi:hypothetical protein